MASSSLVSERIREQVQCKVFSSLSQCTLYCRICFQYFYRLTSPDDMISHNLFQSHPPLDLASAFMSDTADSGNPSSNPSAPPADRIQQYLQIFHLYIQDQRTETAFPGNSRSDPEGEVILNPDLYQKSRFLLFCNVAFLTRTSSLSNRLN